MGRLYTSASGIVTDGKSTGIEEISSGGWRLPLANDQKKLILKP